MNRDPLEQDVQYLKGVGPQKAERLAKLGIATVGDLLYLFPRDYRDLRNATPIAQLAEEGIQVIHVRIEHAIERTTRNGKSIINAGLSDETGYASARWFNRPRLADSLPTTTLYRVAGRFQRSDLGWLTINPQITPIRDEDMLSGPGLIPIYPTTEGLHPEAVRDAVRAAVTGYAESVPELVPPGMRERLRLRTVADALRGIHAPIDQEDIAVSRRRLAFDEFLVLQTALAIKRAEVQTRTAPPIPVTPRIDARIRRLFPFAFTAAQNRAATEIAADLARSLPMNRLLHGDVGAGKTAVAIYAILAAVAAGYQTALMAPTEVLARQHYQTLDRYLEHSRVRRALLTGSLTAKQREKTVRQLTEGAIDLVVGTHALVSKDVEFAKLGLVVIDEQHKFGVRQRAEFQRQATMPHHLVMTATPIPRSLAMTWFGDLDISVLNEKPPGRQETITKRVPAEQRDQAYDFLRKRIDQGAQGLVVAPRIDGEDDHVSVRQLADEFAIGRFADIPVGVVHGRLPDDEKESAVAKFRSGELRILICTVVLEVGLDVPNASVVLIENAERFGLAQLHQIRGRVGRGSERGACFLIHHSLEPDVASRLDAVARNNDGFEIAEIDAEIRGIGEPIGVRQHGFVRPRIGDFVRDVELLRLARDEARRLVDADRRLEHHSLAPLRSAIIDRFADVLQLAFVG